MMPCVRDLLMRVAKQRPAVSLRSENSDGQGSTSTTPAAHQASERARVGMHTCTCVRKKAQNLAIILGRTGVPRHSLAIDNSSRNFSAASLPVVSMGCSQSVDFGDVRRTLDGLEPIVVGKLFVQHDSLPVCRKESAMIVDRQLRLANRRVQFSAVQTLSLRPELYEIHLVVLSDQTGKCEVLRLRARTAAEYEVWHKAVKQQTTPETPARISEEVTPTSAQLKRARSASYEQREMQSPDEATGATGLKV
eukprot:3368337-Pleurochrysis_carterae.AAC.2